MAAYLPKSSTENERSAVVITTGTGWMSWLVRLPGRWHAASLRMPGRKCHVDEQMGFIGRFSRGCLPAGRNRGVNRDGSKSNRQSNAYSPFVKMSIRKHIPNTITCLSLLSGCVASVMALHGNLCSALIWLL